VAPQNNDFILEKQYRKINRNRVSKDKYITNQFSDYAVYKDKGDKKPKS